jgi:hypothetical protein
MPVHNKAENTWIKLRNQRFASRIAANMTPIAALAYQR